MKVRTTKGEIVPLASSIGALSGYGSVKWHEIEEFIPEPTDIAMGWKENLKVLKDEKT